MVKENAKPKLSAYQAMLLICSALAVKGKAVLERDTFVQNLSNALNNENKILFEDICFKLGADGAVVSEDVNMALTMLHVNGVVLPVEPMGKLIVAITPLLADDVLGRYSDEYSDAALDIADKL